MDGTVQGLWTRHRYVEAWMPCRIKTDLVTPGYARWSLPEDIVEEAISSDD